MTAKAQSENSFPAIGHEYQVDFGGGNAFTIAFKSDKEMTFTKLQDPNKGQIETIYFTQKRIRDGIHMVYWQEANKTTVVHVEDFAEGVVYTNITAPDGSFFNGSSKLIKVK